MADMGQQTGCESTQRLAIRCPVCARLFGRRLWAALPASHAGCTSNPKVCTPRFTHPAPFAPHGMAYGHGACHPFAGYGNPTVIQIGHSCHSALTHANDMRFAACHPCTCSCLTCLTCMRRFPAADSPRAGATRSDPEPGSKSGAATFPTSHHSFTLLHTCPP